MRNAFLKRQTRSFGESQAAWISLLLRWVIAALPILAERMENHNVSQLRNGYHYHNNMDSVRLVIDKKRLRIGLVMSTISG